MNPVYVRMLAYVLSGVFALIPAEWAGFVSYNAEAMTLTVHVESLAVALMAGYAFSIGIMRRWGKW